jgi:transposase InsO family protein
LPDLIRGIVHTHYLKGEFQAGAAGAAGAKRVSGIRYLRTPGGWIYLTVVLDLYDRKVIGWAFSSEKGTVRTKGVRNLFSKP